MGSPTLQILPVLLQLRAGQVLLDLSLDDVAGRGAVAVCRFGERA